MATNDAFITFINEFKTVSPIITEEQYKGLLRRGVEEHGLAVDDAVIILNASGLAIGEKENYFEILGFSIAEFQNESEADIVALVNAAHEKRYRISLNAGGRVRPDGKTEEQWREILNQARDTLTDKQKRHAHITMLEDDVLPLPESVSDEEIPVPESTSNLTSEQNSMILIPEGTFDMGSNDSEANDDEKPVHSVHVDAFYIDKHPVTNAQYMEFVHANPQWKISDWLTIYIFPRYLDADYLKDWFKGTCSKEKADHPVNWVSWYAAMAYAEWVGKRLPTEAEWEKAARGGAANQRYPWGNSINDSRANYDKRIGETTPINMYPPNRYGLNDMVGNVSEWCLDEWNGAFYEFSDSHNPVSGGSIEHIVENYKRSKHPRAVRGSSWYSPMHELRISYRSWSPPRKTRSTIGFRCVKSVE